MLLSPLPTHAQHGFRALLNGFSQIFLQNHPGCGLLVLLAIGIGAPDLLGGALLGGLSSTLTAQRWGYARADIEQGLYGYNGILLGLLISLKFTWSPLLTLLIIASAGLSSLLLAPWLQRARERHWQPAFTFPFVALGWALLSLAVPLHLQLHGGTSIESLPFDWLGGLAALARGLGQVIFLDSPLAGVCLFAALLLADRRAACWALLGSAAGMLLALCLGWAQDNVLAGLYGYNAALVAIALSQRHKRCWPALLGMLLAIFLQPGFEALGLPALTMPFILACWLIGAGQRLLRKTSGDCTPL